MEDLFNLNTSNQKTGEKVKKFDDLANGEYLVKSFKLKETPFGLRLYAQIDDFYLILPPRYTDKINSGEQVQELNEKKMKMVYNGKNKDEFNKLMIDFKLLETSSSDGNISAESDEEEMQVVKPPVKKQKIQKK